MAVRNNPRTAFDVKECHLLGGFTDDQLRQVPVLAEGSRLEEGAIYVDLRDPARSEIKAVVATEVGPGGWYASPRPASITGCGTASSASPTPRAPAKATGNRGRSGPYETSRSPDRNRP